MFQPSRPSRPTRAAAPLSFADHRSFPRPAAPSTWGAGPEEEDILRAAPTVRVRFKPGQGGTAAPWQLHESAEERVLFDKAHIVLDNPLPADTITVTKDNPGMAGGGVQTQEARSSKEATLAAAQWLFAEAYIVGASRRGVSSLTAESQRALSFNRFISERKQKEFARKLLGIQAPTGLFGNRPPASWRNLDAALGSDAYHQRIDNGADYAAERARFCDTRRRPAPPAGCGGKFDTERWRLEFARAVIQAGPRTLLKQATPSEGILLGAPAPEEPKKPGFLEKQRRAAQEQQRQRQEEARRRQEERAKGSTPSTPPDAQPDTPATPRRRGGILDRLREQRLNGSQDPAPPSDGPAASDPALLEELAALELLASAPASLPSADLPTLLRRALELTTASGLLVSDQERAGAVAELLRAELLNRAQEATPGPPSSADPEAPVMNEPAPSTDVATPGTPTPDSKAPLTPDQQACADSMKQLVEDAMKTGMTLEEARELLAAEVERHGPGLFRQLWNWVVQAIQGLFGDDSDVPPSASAPLLPSEAAQAAAQAMSQAAGAAQPLPNTSADPLDDPTSDPPPGAETMGAGPDDEDPAPNIIERTQNRFLTLFKWGAAALVIILGGWFVAATIIVPRVVASAAPVFGDVVRQGLQSGVQLQSAALSNADKVLPLLTGGAGGAASGAASLLSSGASKALPLVLNA